MDNTSTIRQQLEEALQPTYLSVINESNRHNVPPDSQTHFKVVIVSAAFDGQPLLARHRMVYRVLEQVLAGSVHALALHTYTSAEWEQHCRAAPASPNCRGGGQ